MIKKHWIDLYHFSKKYFDTEVEPMESAKDIKEYDINNPIYNVNDIPEESEIITTKPENNEGAALPVIS